MPHIDKLNEYVCMYVFMYACMYVCMYVPMYMYVCLHWHKYNLAYVNLGTLLSPSVVHLLIVLTLFSDHDYSKMGGVWE